MTRQRVDYSKVDFAKVVQRVTEPRNGHWKGMDDIDHVETRPVDLKEFVHAGLRCEHVVDQSRTKIHLFTTKEYPGKWGVILTGRISRVAREVLGEGARTDWVPELESWYIELDRAVPDAALAGRRIIDALVSSPAS